MGFHVNLGDSGSKSILLMDLGFSKGKCFVSGLFGNSISSTVPSHIIRMHAGLSVCRHK